MPFLLSIIGIVLIVSAYKNTYSQLGSLVASDFTGSGNFLYWMIAILLIGSIGYYSSGSSKISKLFLVLIIIGILVSGNTANVLNTVLSQLNTGTTPQAGTSASNPFSGTNADSFAGAFLNGVTGGILNNNAVTDFSF